MLSHLRVHQPERAWLFANSSSGYLCNGCYSAKDAAVCGGVMQTGGEDNYMHVTLALGLSSVTPPLRASVRTQI